MIEMPIARVQNEAMLENNRRDPDVVRRNQRSLHAKLPINVRVMVRRLIVGEENFDAHREEKMPQRSLVLHLTSSADEAGPKLGNDDER